MAAEATKRAGVCPEKRALLVAFEEAVREMVELSDQQVAALTSSGKGLERFQVAVDRARQKRERAKALYLAHLRTHGC